MFQKRRTETGQHNVQGVFEALDDHILSIQEERCVRVRNRNARCTKCADACASGCIHAEGGSIKVDITRCVACGSCATVCPTSALSMLNPLTSEIARDCLRQRAYQEGDEVVLGCGIAEQYLEGRGEKRSAVWVACVGRIDEAMLIQLTTSGISQVRILVGACGACLHHPARVLFDQVCVSAAHMIEALGLNMQVICECVSPDGEKSQSCDTAFSNDGPIHVFSQQQPIALTPYREQVDLDACKLWTEQDQMQAEEKAQEPSRFLKVMEDGTLPHFIPDRSEDLLTLLSQSEIPDQLLETRIWSTVHVNEELCSGCGMCAVFCPTGALARTDRILIHTPCDCVQCRLCMDICPEMAIRISPCVKSSQLMSGEGTCFTLPKRDWGPSGPHQIVNNMQYHIPGAIYER